MKERACRLLYTTNFSADVDTLLISRRVTPTAYLFPLKVDIPSLMTLPPKTSHIKQDEIALFY
jgi:hypothetical protein